MSSSSKSVYQVAHVEDAEEDSGSSVNGIEGTRKYALSEAPMSPTKQRPNTSKSRTADRRPDISRSTSGSAEVDESLAPKKREKQASRRTPEKDRGHPELRARERERCRKERQLREEEEDRKAAAAVSAAAAAAARDDNSRPLRKQRPTALKTSATQPIIQQYRRGHVEDPASYGVQQPAKSGNRPRAQTSRPASYYAGQKSQPAPLTTAWHQPHYPPPQFPAVGSFPPRPTWTGAGASPDGFAGRPPPSPVGPPAGHMDGSALHAQDRRLRQRFEPRAPSPMAYQRQPQFEYHKQIDYFDELPSAPRHARHPSQSSKAEEDRRRMPPPVSIPNRAQSAMPLSLPYRPPPPPLQRPKSRQGQSRPPSAHRRSVGFADQQGYDDDDFLGQDDLFHDMSPHVSFDQRRAIVPQPRSRRNSFVHEQYDYDAAPPPISRGRPPLYGSAALPTGGVSLDAKMDSALRYQEAVNGGPTIPLTAETLRKAGKRGGVPSSRSTKSSGSRDDSDYKRSNATGITRTSYNSEDVTIKVSGGGRVRMPGGAEIECEDGGEITLTTTSRPGGSRSVSDKASMIYPQIEDSRSRLEQRALPYWSRAPSQSDSQSRGYAPSQAPYEAPHAPYEAPHAPYGAAHAPYDGYAAGSYF